MTIAPPSPSAPGRGPTRRRGKVQAIVAALAAVGLVLVCVGAWITLRDRPASEDDVESIPVPAVVAEAPAAPAPEEPTDLAGIESPFAGKPQELIAPAIDLDAKVFPIRVTNGSLTPPKDASTVGWDEGTSVVGAGYGTSVVTGHTLRGSGGAMARLGLLKEGDAVSVRTDKGTVDYVVTTVKAVPKTAIGKEIPALYAADGANLLVLITCSDWTGSRHLDNTIVIAQPVV